MAANFSYALKEHRKNSATPFYIGKGTCSRDFDHLIKPEETEKYRRIKDIERSNNSVFIDILVDDIDESQSLKIEADLMSAFGTSSTGGILTNSIKPSGLGTKNRTRIIVP